MKIRTHSDISSIQILGKTLRNIKLDGELDHMKYDGLVAINDTPARGVVRGLINFSQPRLLADIKADIDYLNINYFTGAKGSQIVSGYVDGNLAMKDLNDLTLDANLRHVSFNDGKQKFNIPDGSVKAFFEDGNRVLAVNAPNVVNGRISGRFNLADLPGMIENGLNKILVGPAPKKL